MHITSFFNEERRMENLIPPPFSILSIRRLEFLLLSIFLHPYNFALTQVHFPFVERHFIESTNGV